MPGNSSELRSCRHTRDRPGVHVGAELIDQRGELFVGCERNLARNLATRCTWFGSERRWPSGLVSLPPKTDTDRPLLIVKIGERDWHAILLAIAIVGHLASLAHAAKSRRRNSSAAAGPSLSKVSRACCSHPHSIIVSINCTWSGSRPIASYRRLRSADR